MKNDKEKVFIMDENCMWEILVPTVRNNGKPFKLRYHKVWDSKVKNIAGGLTIISPVKGVWISHSGEEFKERMIPVRIMCSKEEIIKIAEMSKIYYEQISILVYKISNEAFII